MEDVNCYNCRSDRSVPYASENGYDLVKCSGCGLLYVTPRLSAEEVAEGHRYGMHEGDAALEVTGYFNKDKIGFYLRILNDFYGAEHEWAGKSWLDIGCGHGEFLAAITQFTGGKSNALGLEPNVHKQESAKKHGIRLTAGSPLQKAG